MGANDDRSMVLHAVASGGMYGIERMLATLLPSLQSTGRPVALLCLGARSGEGGTLGRLLELKGVRVFYLELRRNVHPRDLMALWTILKRITPGMVHLHGYKAMITVGLVARLLRIPVVATVHSERASAPELHRVLVVEGFALRQFKHLIAVSNGVADDLAHRGITGQRISVIHNGIDDPGLVAETRDGPAAPFRAIVVGRLYEPKNVHVAIEAIALLAARGYRCLLEVIGDGPELVSLRQQAKARGIEGQIEFVGFVDDVDQRLRRASLFLMPSRSEGIPLALLEAMAMRLPIIASRVGGIPEIVTDDREALLVAPDMPDELAKAISRVMANPALASELASAARDRYVREFQTESMRRAHEALYASIMRSTE